MSEPSTEQPSHLAAQLIVGLALPLVFVTVGVGPIVANQASLPATLITHWGFDGQPNGTMSLWAFTSIVAFMTVVPSVVMVGLARHSRPARYEISAAMGFLAFFAGLWAAVSVTVVRTNVDVSTADSTSRSFGGAVAIVAVALASGALASTVARTLEAGSRAPTSDGEALPTIGLKPGERAQWISGCRSKFAWPLATAAGVAAVVVLIAGLVAAVPHLWWISFGLSALALVGLGLTSIRVTADRRGLRVNYGPFPWPRTSIPLDKVETAHVEADAVPMQWGGWGYRGSLTLVGRASIVLRRGPALRLDLQGGRTLLVTVDDPAAGAGVLNDLRTPASPPGPRQ